MVGIDTVGRAGGKYQVKFLGEIPVWDGVCGEGDAREMCMWRFESRKRPANSCNCLRIKYPVTAVWLQRSVRVSRQCGILAKSWFNVQPASAMPARCSASAGLLVAARLSFMISTCMCCEMSSSKPYYASRSNLQQCSSRVGRKPIFPSSWMAVDQCYVHARCPI